MHKATPLTSYPGTETDPALSPDGKQVAFAWDGPAQDNFDIYVRRIGGGDPLRLTNDAASDRFPAWSRDGDFIAFVRSEGEMGTALYVIPALGGAERRLCAAGSSSLTTKINWTADGKALVLSENHTASVIQAETGDKTTLSIPLNRKSHFHLEDPSLSPDGKKLAVIVSDAEEGDSIHVAAFSSSNQIEGPVRESPPDALQRFRVSGLGAGWGDSLLYGPPRRRAEAVPYRGQRRLEAGATARAG